MIVVEKNKGNKLPYNVRGNKITFNDDLTINLATREQDWPVHIDVCLDAEGALVLGAAAGRKYVAEIDIPERKYEFQEVEATEGEEAEEKQVALPLDMSEVVLTLWSIGKEEA